ncbi:MAG: adenylate kinase [Eubacteriales bacterium]
MGKKIVLLGAPGSGKGTQSALLSEALGIPTISTGNILRAEIQAGSDLGKKVQAVMDAGKLVDGSLILSILSGRVSKPDCEKGYILDGVPRTIEQAEEMEKQGIEVNCVLSINIPDERVVGRMVGRRVCSACSAPFHLESAKPKVEGVCDACGGNLIQRKDDSAETVQRRLDVYKEETAPLVDYYKAKGVLQEVEDQPEISAVTSAMLKLIEG